MNMLKKLFPMEFKQVYTSVVIFVFRPLREIFKKSCNIVNSPVSHIYEGIWIWLHEKGNLNENCIESRKHFLA
jgi:hypothetical protein